MKKALIILCDAIGMALFIAFAWWWILYGMPAVIEYLTNEWSRL